MLDPLRAQVEVWGGKIGCVGGSCGSMVLCAGYGPILCFDGRLGGNGNGVRHAQILAVDKPRDRTNGWLVRALTTRVFESVSLDDKIDLKGAGIR